MGGSADWSLKCPTLTCIEAQWWVSIPPVLVPLGLAPFTSGVSPSEELMMKASRNGESLVV